jgi:outer membrane protein OmpA-like peptidoglycan-associated protein
MVKSLVHCSCREFFYINSTINRKARFMKKGSALLVILLLGISAGCGKQRKKQDLGAEKPAATKEVAINETNIPMAQDQAQSFFDDDLGEFELVDNNTENKPEQLAQGLAATEVLPQEELADEFAWAETEEKKAENSLQAVYYEFDHYVAKNSETDKITHNAQVLKGSLEQEKNTSKTTIVVEGHACHAAGSAIYNMALSEKRAKDVADRLVSEGVSRDQIKIVGRGKEFPAIVNGKPVTGSIEEQWPNRRVEVSVINA